MCALPAVDLGIFALYAQHKDFAVKTRALIDFLVECFSDKSNWDRAAPDPIPG